MKFYFFQYAQIVMVLERSFRKEELAEYQLKYSIRLREEFEGGMEVRGLMVYKQTKKTRAQQKIQALYNWKVTANLFVTCPLLSFSQSPLFSKPSSFLSLKLKYSFH